MCHLNLRKLHEQPGYEVMCVIHARPSYVSFVIFDWHVLYRVFVLLLYAMCMYAAVITSCLLMNSGKSMYNCHWLILLQPCYNCYSKNAYKSMQM